MDDRTEPRIIAQHGAWLVVDKPAGWHSVSHGGGEDRTIEGWLRATLPAQDLLEGAGLAHRLDEGTSGCLVAARTVAALATLRAAFSGDPTVHAIEKRYRAWMATGVRERGQFALHFTGRHRGSAKVTVRERGDPGDRGVCRWRVLERAGKHDLVEIELVGPGRRHQIRAGFAWLGFPLASDGLYLGTPRDGFAMAALHAHAVVLDGVEVIADDARFGTP